MGNELSLENLLRDAQINAAELSISADPHIKEMADSLLGIMRAIVSQNPISYRNLSPEEVAKLYLKNSDVTRRGLQILARKYPDQFAQIIPQAIDQATKLFAHEYFLEDLLPSRVAEANSNHAPLSLVLIDVDNFKSVNDTYSHAAGTHVIKTLASEMKKYFRWQERRGEEGKKDSENRKKGADRRVYVDSGDLIARLHNYEASPGRVGGDEFALILYGCDVSTAERKMNEFLQKILKHNFSYGDTYIKISLSIGVASLTGGINADELYKAADNALYQVKNAGKGAVKVHTQ